MDGVWNFRPMPSPAISFSRRPTRSMLRRLMSSSSRTMPPTWRVPALVVTALAVAVLASGYAASYLVSAAVQQSTYALVPVFGASYGLAEAVLASAAIITGMTVLVWIAVGLGIVGVVFCGIGFFAPMAVHLF